jgi:hypothetical protein
MTAQKEPKVEAPARATALDELKDVRRSLQDAGITLLQAATAAISAAAKDTLSATNSVIAAAEDTLDAAEEKLRKVRAQFKSRA